MSVSADDTRPGRTPKPRTYTKIGVRNRNGVFECRDMKHAQAMMTTLSPAASS